jgi:large subunit ribosomal protein L18
MSATKGSRKYIPLFRRRREGKTDYKKRKAVILARKPFININVSDKNILAQVIKASPSGDQVIVSSHSRELLKYGWKGSRKAIPAAYLTGLITGLKAVKKGLKETILYTGTNRYIRGTKITAAAKGLTDAGLTVPLDRKTLPSDECIQGEHIATYATLLMKMDKARYEARFSDLIDRGLDPEKYSKHFDEVRKNIKKDFERVSG